MGINLKDLLDYFQRIHPRQIDLNLSRMERVLRVLGNPHTHLPPVIHVAGTNGKGSTISYLRHIYEAAGLKVHVYTSPHLIRYNERIRLAGKLITDEQLAFYLNKVRIANGSSDLTFFEAKTVVAFMAFCEHPADVLLLETGLGGRLDATNVVVAPIACVLTPISLDHQDFLGESLEEIAQEKAGIIKPGAKVFIGAQQPQVQKILKDRANQLHARVYAKDREWQVTNLGDMLEFQLSFLGQNYSITRPRLAGRHQLQNAGLAAAVALGLKDRLPIPESAIVYGIQNAVWPGRLQCLMAGGLCSPQVKVWIDGAHNEEGFYALRQFIEDTQKKQKKETFVCVAMLKNRDPKLFFQVFEEVADQFVLITMPKNERFHEPAYLATYTEKPTKIIPVEDLNNFFQEKQIDAPRIFIAGSLYLVGKIFELNNIVLD